MKTSEICPKEARQLRTEAFVARHVRELFRHLPLLAGFWVPHLKVGDLAVSTCWGAAAGRELYHAVMHSLLELAESRPEALQLMRGRTFARMVH